MFDIAKCANCNKEIKINTDAHTSCSECKLDFCFAMGSTCFTEYHRKHSLTTNHRAISLTNPAWIINLKTNKE